MVAQPAVRQMVQSSLEEREKTLGLDK
jgi:hypothetical protein